MSKSISFEYEGKEYTLEFNRKSVERMERMGFIAEEITQKPLTSLPMLFHGAFYMHHKGVTRDLTDKILESVEKVSDLIGKLAEMYNEPIMALIGDEDNSKAKNVKWAANWN